MEYLDKGRRDRLEIEVNQRVTRKQNTPIKVYCLPEEKEVIERQAKQAGLSVARYLREIGQGYQIRGIVDLESVRELARINGDLGRLGGLLKLWMTDDVRTAQFSERDIRDLLKRIEKTQEEMGRVMQSVVRPRIRS